LKDDERAIIQKIKGADYVGCFKDSNERALSNHVYLSGDGSDFVRQCRKITREKGGHVFAMQDKYQCFYGPNDNNYARYGRANECKLFCGSQSSGMNCGGYWQQDVYKVSTKSLE